MNAQQEYIHSLIQQETKLSLEEFFKDIHKRFYPTQDISFSLRRHFGPCNIF